MADTLDPLILDLVEWCSKERRSYSEVIDVWRTSCPRLTVWEDALDRGLLLRKSAGNRGTFIEVTAKGRKFINEYNGKVRPSAGTAECAAAQPVH